MKKLLLLTLTALPLACSAEPTDSTTTDVKAEVSVSAATSTAGVNVSTNVKAKSEVTSKPLMTLLEGFHYERLKAKQPTVNPNNIEVVEVFSYSCGHCYALDSFVEEWRSTKAADVDFVHVPAVTPRWEIYAKMYYTAAQLGMTDKLHPHIFNEIHRKRNRLNTPSSIQQFFEKHGVSAGDFYTKFNSFSTARNVSKARKKMELYEMESVPLLVVNGEFKVLNSGAKTRPEYFEIVNALIDKVRQERAGK